jgi:hypothetical protein
MRRAEAQGQRERGRGTYTATYTVTGIESDGTLVLRGGKGRDTYTTRLKPRRAVPGIAAGEVVEVVKAWADNHLLEVRPGSAEAVAERQAAETYEERTHRAVVSECHIDPLKGGSFTIESETMNMTFNVTGEDGALRFLSLRKGDVVEVTLSPDDAGLEEFRHLARANGAKPRSPVDFDDADMEWLGLTATRSDSGG